MSNNELFLSDPRPKEEWPEICKKCEDANVCNHQPYVHECYVEPEPIEDED